MTAGQVIGDLILWLIVAVIVVAIVYVVMNWLYRRSTKEVSFVRTGFLGEKVVINGGAFVWPIIHDITPVNMNVLQMEVMRARDGALITKDRMRVDVEAEFYVRVEPTVKAVSTAASTLGRRTMEQVKLYHTPLGPEADTQMNEAFTRLAESHDEDPVLHIEAREIRARRKAGGVVWFDFKTLCGGPRSQNDYLEMVNGYADHFGLKTGRAELEKAALQWAMTRGARSGRVAWQFIQDYAGRKGVRLS